MTIIDDSNLERSKNTITANNNNKKITKRKVGANKGFDHVCIALYTEREFRRRS